MGLKEKLFKVLNKAKDELTDEDKAQIKTLLEGTPTEEQAESAAADEPEAGIAPEPAEEETATEAAAEKPPDAQPEPMDAEEETAGETAIPAMAKGVPTEEAEGTAIPEPQKPPAMLQDEQGEELPADYEQIIDALTAKNMVLEAENARLKAKTEGAFGLSSKPGEMARVNPLYDNNTTDIHFKK